MKKSSELPSFPITIDVGGAKERFPFCIVWTPLPFLTPLVPFIGHVGITDSKGRLYDFQGDFIIGKERLLFGKVVKYLDISRQYIPSGYSNPPGSPEDIRKEVEAYDKNLNEIIHYFRTTQKYSFLRNNCHDFVASVLNALPPPAIEGDSTVKKSSPPVWTVASIMWAVARKGKYVNKKRFFKSHWQSFGLYGLLVLLFTFSILR